MPGPQWHQVFRLICQLIHNHMSSHCRMNQHTAKTFRINPASATSHHAAAAPSQINPVLHPLPSSYLHQLTAFLSKNIHLLQLQFQPNALSCSITPNLKMQCFWSTTSLLDSASELNVGLSHMGTLPKDQPSMIYR